mmetsp:Transcript_9532/g.21880  ORF Transcript_9532/g.21880 Transcript_9532/m.21880 type:complete len:548 (+) Transcript_9532:15-1658(+)|eukprot:CAMPEP_0114549204 /NCGR_PEP_ID=MMETSP0114-20121206/5403_1 /TAXON_ID=31324 /ORGANISM="Goniomonas sp, Strain m" /LENGTH=547 /DNA_ID=CAMNT_0001733871 /DNA_START=10 /DNA_END=1653 /DNA_ORIENTATION=+
MVQSPALEALGKIKPESLMLFAFDNSPFQDAFKKILAALAELTQEQERLRSQVQNLQKENGEMKRRIGGLRKVTGDDEAPPSPSMPQSPLMSPGGTYYVGGGGSGGSGGGGGATHTTGLRGPSIAMFKSLVDRVAIVEKTLRETGTDVLEAKLRHLEDRQSLERTLINDQVAKHELSITNIIRDAKNSANEFEMFKDNNQLKLDALELRLKELEGHVSLLRREHDRLDDQTTTRLDLHDRQLMEASNEIDSANRDRTAFRGEMDLSVGQINEEVERLGRVVHKLTEYKADKAETEMLQEGVDQLSQDMAAAHKNVTGVKYEMSHFLQGVDELLQKKANKAELGDKIGRVECDEFLQRVASRLGGELAKNNKLVDSMREQVDFLLSVIANKTTQAAGAHKCLSCAKTIPAPHKPGAIPNTMRSPVLIAGQDGKFYQRRDSLPETQSEAEEYLPRWPQSSTFVPGTGTRARSPERSGAPPLSVHRAFSGNATSTPAPARIPVAESLPRATSAQNTNGHAEGDSADVTPQPPAARPRPMSARAPKSQRMT